MGSSVGRLRTRDGVGTRILIMVCVLPSTNLLFGCSLPKMGIFGLAVFAKIIVYAIQTVIAYSSDRLLMTFIARYASMHKPLLMCLILPFESPFNRTSIPAQSCKANAEHSSFPGFPLSGLLLLPPLPLFPRLVQRDEAAPVPARVDIATLDQRASLWLRQEQPPRHQREGTKMSEKWIRGKYRGRWN